MRPAITVVLPTVRPRLLDDAVGSIIEGAGRIPFELVVVADWHVAEPLLGVQDYSWYVRKRRGPIEAITYGIKRAKGTFLFTLSDEDRLHPGALGELYKRALKNPDKVYTPWWQGKGPWTYYGKPFPPFPFMSKRTAEKLGGFFDPAYKAHYCDPDLGMRCWAHGVEIEFVTEAGMDHPNDPTDEASVLNRQQWFDQDEALFRARWDEVGEFVRR